MNNSTSWINPFATMDKYPYLWDKYNDLGIDGIENQQEWFRATYQFITRAIVLGRIKPVYYTKEECEIYQRADIRGR